MAETTDLSLLNFPEKLWYMVNEPNFGQIHWNADGTTIIIPKNYEFVSKVLNNPSKILFKTKNFSSFVRQLNLYGFRKVSAHRKIGQAQPMATDRSEFKHPSFRRDRKDLLDDVKRQPSTNKKEESPSEEKPRASNNEPCTRRHSPVNSNPSSTMASNMWTNWDPFLYPYPWMSYGGAAGGYNMGGYNMSSPSQYQAQGYYSKDGLPYYLPPYIPMPSYPYEEPACALKGSRMDAVANESKLPVSCPVPTSSQTTSSGDLINISVSASVSTGNDFLGNSSRVSKNGVHGNLGNTFLMPEEAKKPIPAQTAEVTTTSNNGAPILTDWKNSDNKPGENATSPSNSKVDATNTKEDEQKGFECDTGTIIQDYKRMKFMKVNDV